MDGKMSKRQEQKKTSREKNDITTMQLSNSLKLRLKRIQKLNGFDKQDEALDEVLSFYEDANPNILSVGDDNNE
jgi:hypothetical protein